MINYSFRRNFGSRQESAGIYKPTVRLLFYSFALFKQYRKSCRKNMAKPLQIENKIVFLHAK